MTSADQPLAITGRTSAGRDSGEQEQRRQSQGERLHETVTDAGVELFHDSEFTTYATFHRDGHRETWPIQSTGFRRYVRFLFYERYGQAPRGQAVAEFLGTLEGQAQYAGKMEQVYVRVAPIDGGLAIDLGDADWSAIEVHADGWRVVPDAPVKFVRPRGMQALPVPARGGSLEELRPFLNVEDEEQWRLLLGFLIGMLRPRGPYPVLALHGEQGAAKSTAMRVLRKLVDPRETLDRAAPRDDHDLAIHAMHNWVIALDNLSRMPDWLSDGLARLATGAGYSTRQLYTDAEEISFNAQRPVMLNGIGEVIERSDLLDRALLVNLAPITDERRQEEADFWASYDAARPRILGALLDAACTAVDRAAVTKLASKPRMADFARWVTAAEPALGWEPGGFLAAYYANRGQAHELALDADPIAVALREFMASRDAWEGSASALLDALGLVAGEGATHRRNWPRAANALSNRLSRLAPNLRTIGIVVDRRLAGDRRITIEAARYRERSPASPEPPASPKSLLNAPVGPLPADRPRPPASPERSPATARDIAPGRAQPGDQGDQGDDLRPLAAPPREFARTWSDPATDSHVPGHTGPTTVSPGIRHACHRCGATADDVELVVVDGFFFHRGTCPQATQ